MSVGCLGTFMTDKLSGLSDSVKKKAGAKKKKRRHAAEWPAGTPKTHPRSLNPAPPAVGKVRRMAYSSELPSTQAGDDEDDVSDGQGRADDDAGEQDEP